MQVKNYDFHLFNYKIKPQFYAIHLPFLITAYLLIWYWNKKNN